jgi:transcriptional regulator with XRE-family HTH domain
MGKLFKDILLEERAKRNATQREMAALMDISEKMYGFYESGKFAGSPNKIAKYLRKLSDLPGMVKEAQEEYRTKPALKSVSSDQANAVLMNINSYSFVSVELLCELLSKVSGRPLDEIRKRAQQLISDRRQRVEEVLRLLEDFS